MTRTAVLLCGHGSRDPEALAGFARAAAGLRARLAADDFAVGHLEFARPTIAESLAALAARGATRIDAVPAMLLGARHVATDLPREMHRFAAVHPGIEWRLADALGSDDRLLGAARERIVEAASGPYDASALVVVGRGTRDPGANAAIGKIARRLRAALGFAREEAAFAGIAEPRLAAVLRRIAGLGVGRVVVFPYFLFPGVLVKRLQAETAAAAAAFPAIDFVAAGCLADHPLMLDALAERARFGG